jgi:hypothetical protein
LKQNPNVSMNLTVVVRLFVCGSSDVCAHTLTNLLLEENDQIVHN